MNAADMTGIALEMNMQPTRDILIHGEDGFIPMFDDQTFTGLWEGLCDVSGRVGTSQLTGQAFVELNGY